MIRPSALAVAQHCGLSPVLSAQHPQGSVAAERGTRIHEEIAAFLRSPDGTSMEVSSMTRAALDWIQCNRGAASRLIIEERIELRDPESDELLLDPNTGTPDLLIIRPDSITVVDYKTGRPEYVDPVQENLQLGAYALAASLKHGIDRVNGVLLFLGDGDTAVSFESEPYPLWEILDRIRKAATRPATPVTGPHCGRCWSRLKCPAYVLPAHEGPTALQPFTRPGGLTAENAAKAALTVDAMEEVVELARENLKAYVRQNGPIQSNGKIWGPAQRNGRKTADVKALEADGLSRYIRQGNPYDVWMWSRARQ